MKILYPSSAQFDLFRWGNLSFTEVDQWILDHFRERLLEITREYNRQALDFALEIVNRQSALAKPAPPIRLADEQMQKKAALLDKFTLLELTTLRNEAASQMESMDAELVPDEVAQA